MKRNGEGKGREGKGGGRGRAKGVGRGRETDRQTERERRIPILLGWAAHIRMTVRTEKSSVCNVIVFMRMIVSTNSRSDPVINSTVPRNVNHRYRGNESRQKWRVFDQCEKTTLSQLNQRDWSDVFSKT